jgi:hypothetical protein
VKRSVLQQAVADTFGPAFDSFDNWASWCVLMGLVLAHHDESGAPWAGQLPEFKFRVRA